MEHLIRIFFHSFFWKVSLIVIQSGLCGELYYSSEPELFTLITTGNRMYKKLNA